MRAALPVLGVLAERLHPEQELQGAERDLVQQGKERG